MLVSTPLSVASSTEPSVSGTSRFFIVDCAKPDVVLRLRAATAPIAIRTGDIVPKPDASVPIAWSLTWSNPRLSDPNIKEYETIGTLRGECPDVGTYSVPLHLYEAGDSPAASTLVVELVRFVRPVLDAPTNMMLPVTSAPFGL